MRRCGEVAAPAVVHSGDGSEAEGFWFNSVSVQTEMALLGQELMLCRAADQDLIRDVGFLDLLLSPQ